MSYDRPQAAEIEAILAVAEKIAKRTNRHFVVNNEKRDAFVKLSAALADGPSSPINGNLSRSHSMPESLEPSHT